MPNDIHNPHDKLFKKAMSDPRVARDIFTAHLPKAITEQANWEALELQNGSFIDRRFHAYEADVIYRVPLKETELLIYSILEHQTKPDKWLPLRLSHYLLLLLMDYHKRNKTQDLPVVCPLIIYTGVKPYTYSTDFFDLFGPGKTLAKAQWLQAFRLIDVCRESEDAMEKQRWFGLVELVFKYRNNQAVAAAIERIMQWLHEWENQGGVDLGKDVLYYVIDQFEQADVDALLDQAKHYLTGELKGETMTIAEQLKQVGRQEGLQQGMQQGSQQATQLIAKKLLAEGMSVEKVAQLTELPLVAVEKLKTSN